MKEKNLKDLPWEAKPVRVAIVGDLILDEYIEGDVSRISPEAPVPVHLVKASRIVAGGGANVARNVRLVGGYAKVFAVTGEDDTAHRLSKLLSDDDVDIENVGSDPDRVTAKKTRITSNSFVKSKSKIPNSRL